MKIRKPAVAGRFYPSSSKEITAQLDTILAKEKPNIDIELGKTNIIGCVVPHAGYMFSAYQALHFFEIIKPANGCQQFDTFIIVNPNHTCRDSDITLDDSDYWESPFGKVAIDNEFASLLDLPVSAASHRFEHSGEVMLPLLQYALNYPFKILPITITVQNQQNALRLAKAIFLASQVQKKNICLIASSDFSHYVDPQDGVAADQLVIDQILQLNSLGIQKVVNKNNISVCGYGPIMTLVEYAKLKTNNPMVKILRRGHSGEVIPSSEVVDYVTILFYSI